MKILITNDDGVHAEQLPNLIRWCRKLGEVCVVVPKVEQSGKSHGIEIKNAYEAKQVQLAPDISVWAVDSTPADCVRFAIYALNLEFELVISGINRGLNMGRDIMYSGTVSAASEAVNQGKMAIALSTPPNNYENAVNQLDEVFDFVSKHHLLEHNNLYNINIPGNPKGIRFTRQGGPFFSDDFLQEENDMYRPCGKPVWEDQNDLNLDTDCVQHGYISISPLTVDRTNKELFAELSALND